MTTCVLLVGTGCGDSGGETAASATDTTTSGTATTGQTTTTGETGESGSSTGEPTGSGTGTSGTTTDPTTDPTTSSTTDPTTDATTTTGTTTGTTTDTTGPACTPVDADDLTCDGVDDDCNGFVDDVDPDGDGFCDCLQIMFLGNPGNAPNAMFETWMEGKGAAVVRIADGSALTPDVVAAHDIIIIDQLTREYTPEEATVLKDWVEAGGGLMSMIGYQHEPFVDVTRANSLLAPLGLQVVAGLFSGPVVDFVAHPLTENLTSITFEGGHRVEAMMGAPDTNTYVASVGPNPVALAAERTEGRVYMWGDEWVQYDMVWNGNPMVEQFWKNAIAWIGPKTFCVLPQ